MKPKINSDHLNKLFEYDKSTGILYWKYRDISEFLNKRTYLSWNARFSGKEAFTSVNSDGYKNGSIYRKNYKAHRVIWCMVYGDWPKEIDHINGIKSDNRIENLRNVDHSINMKNLNKTIANTSGVTGVGWHKATNKWAAYIRSNGKHKHIGLFNCIKEAEKARIKFEKEIGFHWEHGKRKAG